MQQAISEKKIRALITGGGKGLGRSLAVHLLQRHDAEVIVVGRNEANLQSLVQAFPGPATAVVADVALQEDRQKVFDAVKSMGGQLTHVVQNAAIIEPVTLLEDISLEDYRYQMAVNAEAPLFLTLGLLPVLAENARVLLVSSGAAFRAMAGLGSYCISKAALEMTCWAMQEDFKGAPVLFASVRPGGVHTDMVEVMCAQSEATCPYAAVTRQRVADGTLLTPEHSASFLAWLLLHTDDASYERHWNINDPDLEDWQSGLLV